MNIYIFPVQSCSHAGNYGARGKRAGEPLLNMIGKGIILIMQNLAFIKLLSRSLIRWFES